jgi:hypothetical protein
MAYFLVFTPDRGGREDCSVYYTQLVIAKDEAEAKDIFSKDMLLSRITQYEKYFKKKATPDIINNFKNQITFTDGVDEYSGEYEILEVTPLT